MLDNSLTARGQLNRAVPQLHEDGDGLFTISHISAVGGQDLDAVLTSFAPCDLPKPRQPSVSMSAVLSACQVGDHETLSPIRAWTR